MQCGDLLNKNNQKLNKFAILPAKMQ